MIDIKGCFDQFGGVTNLRVVWRFRAGASSTLSAYWKLCRHIVRIDSLLGWTTLVVVVVAKGIGMVAKSVDNVTH